MLEITEESFQKEVIESEIPVLVDFWAEWCGPCKMLAPVLEDLSGEYEGKLKFGKLSTEHHPNLAAANAVTGIPCLILFKGGEEVDRIIGFSPKAEMKQKIDAVLEKI
jgi:thioredoxin 1